MIQQFLQEYSFLSNFYPSDVWYDGVLYPTVEHAYQAAKTFDEQDRKKILEAKTPGQAKRLGRKIKIRDDWEKIKVYVMYELVLQKFCRHPQLRRKLLETKDQTLVEGNKWGDKFWGVDLETKKGRNMLGKLLMQVREELSYHQF